MELRSVGKNPLLQSIELRSFSSTLETKIRVMTQIQYGMGIASVRNDEKKKKQQHVHVYALLCIWKKNRLMKTACSIR